MSSRRHVSEDRRAAAVADYHTSGDPYAVVASRHGVSRSALHSWVNPDGVGSIDTVEDLAYHGGWEVRGGVQRPLFPERRSA